MNKKILKRIILIAIFIIFLYIYLTTVFKYTLLKSIQKSIVDLNESDNYVVEGNLNGFTLYHKDGISKYVYYNSDNKALWIWTDGKKTYTNLNGDVEEMEDKSEPFEFRINEEHVKDMNMLKYALNPFNKVSIEKFKDCKYIRVKFGDDEIVYFDSETKIPKITIYGETISDYYTYKENVVTDTDIELPTE